MGTFLTKNLLILVALGVVFFQSYEVAVAAPLVEAASRTSEITVKLSENTLSRSVAKLDIGGGKIENSFTVENPSRVVLDIRGIKATKLKSITAGSAGVVSQIRFGRNGEILRVVFDCEGAVPPRFTLSGTTGKIELTLVHSPTKSAGASELPSQKVTEDKAPVQEIATATPVSTKPPSPIVTMAPHQAPTIPPVQASTIPSATSIAVVPTTPDRTIGPVTPMPLNTAVHTIVPRQTAVATPTQSPTRTKRPTVTPTETPTLTPTIKPTRTRRPTITPTETVTPRPTKTPRATLTPTATPEAQIQPSPRLPMKSLSSKPKLKGISFEYTGENRTPTIRLALSQRSDFRMNRNEDKSFELVLEGYDLDSDYLSLPQYPPDDFVGMTFVRAITKDDAVHITVGVDRGVRITPVLRDEEIWIRAQG